VYFLDNGRFVEAGPPEEVLDAPKDPRTRRFLRRFASGGQAPRQDTATSDEPAESDAARP
jgi:ABC-type glutathione transport system ATPase component